MGKIPEKYGGLQGKAEIKTAVNLEVWKERLSARMLLMTFEGNFAFEGGRRSTYPACPRKKGWKT